MLNFPFKNEVLNVKFGKLKERPPWLIAVDIHFLNYELVPLTFIIIECGLKLVQKVYGADKLLVALDEAFLHHKGSILEFL